MAWIYCSKTGLARGNLQAASTTLGRKSFSHFSRFAHPRFMMFTSCLICLFDEPHLVLRITLNINCSKQPIQVSLGGFNNVKARSDVNHHPQPRHSQDHIKSPDSDNQAPRQVNDIKQQREDIFMTSHHSRSGNNMESDSFN